MIVRIRTIRHSTDIRRIVGCASTYLPASVYITVYQQNKGWQISPKNNESVNHHKRAYLFPFALLCVLHNI